MPQFRTARRSIFQLPPTTGAGVPRNTRQTPSSQEFKSRWKPSIMTNDQKTQWILQRARTNDGLAPVDVEKFWADDKAARADIWGRDIPQMPLGIAMPQECVFEELGVAEDERWAKDAEWRAQVNKTYNEKSERIVGRKFLPEPKEGPVSSPPGFPVRKGLEDIFEARNEWHAGSWWLMQSAHDEDELKVLLDRVEDRIANLRAFALPPNWDEAKARLLPLGVKPGLYRGQRGPITFAASVYGVENLLFLIMTNPDLAARFRDAIKNAMLALGRLTDEEAGHTPETAPHGFMLADDNCYLLTPEMYEFFGYPILRGLFDKLCPNPGDWRYQHSDSPMSHLLPIFGRLKMTEVNFGPTVTVSEIRRHIPGARIDGHLAPFTFSRNDEERIVAETLRDFDQSREKRGLVFTTAGSINAGSRLSGLRLIMSTIQNFCRYDG